MLTSSYNEIVGLPGSGKTLVKSLLVQNARSNGVLVFERLPLNLSFFDRIKIIIKVIYFIVTNPMILKWWITPISKKYTTTSYAVKVVRNLKFRTIVESIIIREYMKTNKTPLVNDEGIIGKVVVLSLLIGRNTKEVLSLLDFLLPSDTEIIFINAEYDQTIKQMNSRELNLPFWDSMDSKLKKELCERCKFLYMEVGVQRSRKKQSNYRVISNYGSKQKLISSIINNITFRKP